MKDELCNAFHQDLEVVTVPAGLAVGTDFQKSDGDHIGFYVIGPDKSGQYRVQDDGATVPWLEACGAVPEFDSVEGGLHHILREYGLTFDEETCEITSEPMAKSAIPRAGLRLVAALLQLQDFALTPSERAARNRIEDANRDLAQAGHGYDREGQPARG